MSCCVPRRGGPRCSSASFLVFLCFIVGGLLCVPGAMAFSSTALGDFDNVTVMEVSGNFDAIDANGLANCEPRRAIAREFYRTHSDDYDFLVIFTNFPVRLPSLQAKAFFAPAKNDVQGIGLPLYDSTGLYTPDGSLLARLQGTIDMANIASQVLEPTDPEFDDTLLTLSHEMLHRWAAYVHFTDGAIDSDALLGLDNAHWSYLLASEGSSLYGNNWRDNGDGTFTSIEPEQIRKGEVIGRLFNPLEMYLMGLVDKSQVPPMLLIDAPGIDKNHLPVIGETIAGVAKTVTVDDIIAHEGERIPAAADARKEFRIAFIYAVTPGTWSESNAEDRGEVAAINRLQLEWEKRFSILTDGIALMRTTLKVPEPVGTNPGVTTPTFTPAQTQSVNNGVSWLVTQQQPGGYWQDQPGTDRRDTATAVTALKAFPAGSSAAANGQAWLGTVTPENSDFLARKLLGLTNASVTELVVLQNADGGWGSAPGYGSDPVDTALVLQALTARGGAGSGVLTAAVNYLHGRQNPDGGWNVGSGGSMVQPTARTLLALNSYRGSTPIEPDIADGLAWLSARQNGDGGFGNSPSTVVDTAIALQALKVTGTLPTAADNAVTYLLNRQDNSGSWNDSVFQTAQAVEALYAGQVAADLTVATADISFNPVMVSVLPSTVTVIVTVRNLGSNTASSVNVALYENDPAQGNLLGEQTVNVPGNGSVPATFSVTVNSAGLHDYYATVDGNRQIAEANEWNNTASKTLAANMAPPTVGFVLSASAGSEAVTSVSLAIDLSYPWPAPITVNYTVNAASIATPSADYTLAAGTLTFAADETSKAIDLAVVNDLMAEVDKTVIVDLASPSFGTLGTAHHTYTIRDDEAPAVTITSPPAGVIGQNAPQLLYTTTGGNVVLKVDGAVVAKVSGNTLGPLADGAHSVEVSASNSFGVVTTSRVDFTVDTTVPTVIINAPQGVQTTKTPLFDYLVEGATSVVVKVDNLVVSKISGQNLDALTEGNHTLTVTATNAFGRANTASSTFLVDTVPPSVTLHYPYAGGILEEADPQLLYTLSESGTVTVRVDGAVVSKVTGDRLAPLTDGEHTVTVTLTDANDISATATAVFVVELDAEPARVADPGWTPSSANLWSQSDVAVSKDGNVYLAGSTGGSGYDLFIAKYDRAGALLWSKVPVAGRFDTIAMGIDAAENMYVAFSSIDGVGGYSARGNYDVYLAKFDSNGNAVGNMVQIATSYYEGVFDMFVSGSGDVYLAGLTGSASLFPGTGGGMSTWVAKYDKNLVLQWSGQQSHYSYYEQDDCFIALGPDGTVYVAGTIQGRFANNGTQVGMKDYYIARWNSSGYYLDVQQGGTDQNESVYGLGTDAFGNVYLLGSTQGAMSGYTNSGASDFFIVKCNANLQLQWMHQWGTASTDDPAALEVEPDGDLYVVERRNLTKFNRNKNQIWTSQNLTTNGFDTGGSSIDSQGSLFIIDIYFNSTIYKYSDPRIPAITLTAANLTTQLSLPIRGIRSTGAEVLVSSDTGAACASLQYPTSTSWACMLTGLQEGANRLTVVARNTAGFRNTIQATVVKDTMPPVITLTTPAEGSTYSARPTPSYTAPDATVTGYLNGLPVSNLTLPLQGLLPGQNVFRLDAIDPAGNASSVTVNFTAVGAAIGERAYAVGSPNQFGTSAEEEIDQVFVDAGNNVYVIGTTFGNLHGVTNNGRGDVFVSKYDNAGNRLWTRLYGTVDTEYGRGIAIDAAGNLYLVWEVHYVSVKGKSQNWSDVKAAKYDANNVLLWSQSISSTARDYAGGITFDASGNVWVVGTTQGSLNGNPLVGASDGFLAGYNSAGTQLRMVTTKTLGDDTGIAVGCDFGYGVYLAGRDGNGRPFVRRFITTGGEDTGFGAIYAAPASGESYAVAASNILRTVYIAGSIDLGQGGGTDAFLAKCSADGCETQQLGTAEADAAKAMALDTAGNIYLAGYTKGSLLGQSWAGGQDVFIAKYNGNLQRLWVKQFGTSANDAATGSRVDTLGNLFVAGQTTGGLGGANAGGTDGFLVKMAKPDGPVLVVNPVTSPTRLTTQVISGVLSLPVTSLTVSRGPTVSISNGVINPDGTWSFTVSDLVPNADNVLTVNAVDSSGTTSKTVTINVDTLPPALTITPVTSPTFAATQVIAGTIEVGSTLTVEVNPPAVAVPVAVSNGTWGYTAELSEGDNTLVFEAKDEAGNTTSRSTTITLRSPRLTVSPSTITQGVPVQVTLTIENTVVPALEIKVIRDVARDGSPISDPLVRLFIVRDGVTSTDPNVPGDDDGLLDSRVVINLPFDYLNDVQMAPGDYIVMAYTYPSAITATFRITETSQSQTIQGYVLDPQSTQRGGAAVQLLDKWGRSHGYAFTDSAGHYLFNVPAPGEYVLLPALENFAFAKGNLIPFMLPAGQHLSVDLPVVAGTYKVDGQVLDAATMSQIPGGILVRAESSQYLAAPMTRAYGAYSIYLPAGDYQLFADAFTAQGPATQGYLGSRAPLGQVTVSAASTGNNLQLGKATVLVCGQVRDAANMGVAGLVIEATTDSGSGRFATGVTDADGNYCLGLMSDGTWQITLNDTAGQALGYVGNTVAGITAINGSFSGVDLAAFPIEAWIGGVVLKDGVQPVAGVPVRIASATSGVVANGTTATDGSYRLGAHAGTWEVTISPEAQGFNSVLPVTAVIAGGETVIRSFTVAKPEQRVNTIVVTRAAYDARKKVLYVDATSNYANAQLQIDGYGPMNFSKLFKGKNYWTFARGTAARPTTVTVSGPEGAVTATVR